MPTCKACGETYQSREAAAECEAYDIAEANR